MIIKKFIRYFLPSLILFLLFRFLSLFSTCYYGNEYYLYHFDPFSSCKNGYGDISVYHWLIMLLILPGLNYLKDITGKLANKNITMQFLNIILYVFFILLIIVILLFKPFLDFPFSSYFE
jgi:hypothetical protein